MPNRAAPRVVLAAVLLGTIAAGESAFAATRVDLVIDEPFATRSVAWPITTGIPFPRGKLTSVDRCRLIDDRGLENLLQAQVAATWDSEQKSVRWLTIDFIAEPGRKYAIEFGDDVVHAPQFGSPLHLCNGQAVSSLHGTVACRLLRVCTIRAAFQEKASTKPLHDPCRHQPT